MARRVHPAQYRVPKVLHCSSIDVTDAKSAFLDCLAKPAGYLPVFVGREWCVALRAGSKKAAK